MGGNIKKGNNKVVNIVNKDDTKDAMCNLIISEKSISSKGKVGEVGE